VIILRCAVDNSAVDADGWYRLPGSHFRLVARKIKPTDASNPEAGRSNDIGAAPTVSDGPGRSYYPLGYLRLDKEGTKWELASPPVDEARHAQPAMLIFEQGKSAKAVVHWVYRVSQDEQPDYVVFRRVSRQPVPRATKIAPPIQRPPKEPTPPPKRTPSKKAAPSKKTSGPRKKPAPADKRSPARESD
jgi:hypothetical protein